MRGGTLALALLLSCGSGSGSGPGPGALIAFAVCAGSPTGNQTLTVFTTNRTFIDEAHRLALSGQRRIPSFDLLDGRTVDPQWSWHVNESTPAFADAAIELCDGCPSDVEADKSYWLNTVKQFCPWSASVSSVTETR